MQLLLQNNYLNDKWLKVVNNLATQFPTQFIQGNALDETFESETPIVGLDYIPYGSCPLIEYSAKLGLKGLAYSDATFNYAEYSKHAPMLNNGHVLSIEAAMEFFENNPGMWFCRPSKDGKKFTGSVQWSDFYIRMFENFIRRDSYTSFDVVIANPVDVQMEVRWFVVGGKVVEGSMYRHKGTSRLERVTEDLDLVKEAQAFADIWLPHDNVVMDLGLVDGQLKIVEFNCINTSGMYDANPFNVIGALYDYYSGK